MRPPPTTPSGQQSLFDSALPSTSAVVSACGTYRYLLTRRWAQHAPVLGWVMLNPSTADADADDPTIRRCIGFARAAGFGGIVVRNLYALRATDPRALRRHPDPVGPDNDAHLARCADEKITVLAWGSGGGARAGEVLALLAEHGVRAYHLALTRDGHPRHPLYLPRGLTPTPHPLPEPAENSSRATHSEQSPGHDRPESSAMNPTTTRSY
ncbi:DUF1643 domain-containing protein [Nocardia sp. IFM 10818]